MAENTSTAVVKKNVGDTVIAKVDTLLKAGMVLPKDFNAVNAVKASMLKLQETKDRSGNYVLASCTHTSIASALFEMVTRGLDASKEQCYFIAYGDKLQLMPSVYGYLLQVHRLYPNWQPTPRVVFEGDEFEYEIDPDNGKARVVKHIQKLENTDKDFVGAYMYVPTKDGGKELFFMTRKQILTAWAKSPNGAKVAKEFPIKMVERTLIKSATKKIISGTVDLYFAQDNDDREMPIDEQNVVYESEKEPITVVDFDATPTPPQISAKVAPTTTTTATTTTLYEDSDLDTDNDDNDDEF